MVLMHPAGVPEEVQVPAAGGESVRKFHKGNLPRLPRGVILEDALSRIVLACVEHLRANEECVATRAHIEGAHQMRVAIRRLRCCLALFGDLLPANQCQYLDGELRWLLKELAPARDWDVFLDETLPPVLRQFEGEARLDELRLQAEAKQDEGYTRAATALHAQRYTGLVMLLAAWADGRSWHDPFGPPAHPSLASKATDAVSQLLDQLLSAVLNCGADFADLNAERRHLLRIEIKKLRYATEFFASLFPRRRLNPFLVTLKTLQDRLGVENDAAVARRLLLRLTKECNGRERTRLAYAAGLVVGWHAHTADSRQQHLDALWAKLTAYPPFWRRAEVSSAADSTVVDSTAADSAGADNTAAAVA
ncbi:MAG TPA: CHAD domain-containing protein [Defluviicoccus sp.]|nr:CHAD domain-containing protein [Defluviicoccus sp.]